MIFVDKATAAHDRTSGICEAEWRAALGNSQVESAVRTFSVVVIEVRLQHGLEMSFVDDEYSV
jgi:hypothetical protein